MKWEGFSYADPFSRMGVVQFVFRVAKLVLMTMWEFQSLECER